MKIERIILNHVRVPLTEPFRISNGVVDVKDAIIVRTFGGGLVGCGESSPMSGAFYSEDTPESVWEELHDIIIPGVLGASPASSADWPDLLGPFDGSAFAKAGIETAMWDLRAKQEGVPLFRLLGGKRSAVESGLAVGIYDSVHDLVASIDRYLIDGYKRLKIKIQPGWDVVPLTEIRKRYEGLPLMVDANCAYSRDDIDTLAGLDDFHLMMIEQPLPKDDIEGQVQLQQRIKTPLCIDESAGDVETVRRSVDRGACRIVNIKIQRVGGLKNAISMHDACADLGIPVWAGTMPELGIGSAQTLHFATLDNCMFATDVEASSRWFYDDIIEPMIEVVDGMISIPDQPGNAYRLNERKLALYSVREAVFAAH